MSRQKQRLTQQERHAQILALLRHEGTVRIATLAKAFGVTIDYDPRAVAIMRERFPDQELNAARMRMTRIPAGADLVLNKVSKAHGFWIGNVIVMAGVPAIMQAMLDDVAPKLKTGAKMLSVSVFRA